MRQEGKAATPLSPLDCQLRNRLKDSTPGKPVGPLQLDFFGQVFLVIRARDAQDLAVF